MLAVSDSIKQAYNQYTTQRKSYIQVGDNSFFIQNLDVFADAYSEENVIGNAIAKIAKFDIETVNVKGIDDFELFDGIWTGNQYEYVSLGTFKLFNEEGTDDFFSSVTAYDKLVLFNKEYDPTLTTYPTTLYGLLKNICNQAGVELENTSIPNGNQTIASNLFVEKETLKTILKAICQINGCFGIISQDKLKLLLKGTETINLSKYQLGNPEYKRTTWKINQVVLGMTDVEGEYVLKQDDEDVTQNGVHKLVINDNPFVYTQDLRKAYINNLFNQVKGFGYVAFETKWEGLPYMELGDLINIDGKESLALRYNLKSPQGLNSTLSAPSIIDSIIEYTDNSNSISNKQKRTEYLVDKQNQTINQLISDTTEHEKRITTNEQNIDSITQKVSSVYDFVRNATGTEQLIISEAQSGNLLELHITGNFDLNYLSEENELSDENYLTDSYLVVKNSEEEKRVKLPIECLYSIDDVSDEFIIEPIYNEETKTYESKAKVIRRITIDESGNKIVSDSEITTDLGILEIPLFKGQNTLYMESFGGLNYFAKYAILNNVIEQYATKTELDISIKETAKELELSASQKIENATGTDELIAKINLKPGKIDLKGTVTANQNFKVLNDGSIEAKNGSFSGNIYMEDGKVIVGGNGLISNLFFRSSGTRSIYSNLGFETQYQNGANVVERANAYLDIYIPDNFEISKAFLTLQHSTCKWDSSNGEVVGYARKVKIYKATGSYSIDNAYQTIYINDSQLTEIPNALGVESFTPKNIYDASVETQTGIDISSFLEKGHNLFVARSDDELPTSISSSDIQSKTGMGCLSINIIGFMKVNVEEV